MEIETDSETIEIATEKQRVCPECGAAFVPSYGSQVCCSDECKAARKRRLAAECHAEWSERERTRRIERRVEKDKARRRAEFFAERDAAFERAGLPAPRIEVRNGIRTETRGIAIGTPRQRFVPRPHPKSYYGD